MMAGRMLLETELPKPVRDAMVTHLFISYTRPFTEARALIDGKKVRRYPLENSAVPTEYTDLHGIYMGYRNRVFAHTDATKDKTGRGIENEVRIIVADDGIAAAQTRKYSVEPDRLGMTITLCQHLIDQIEEKLTPLFTAHLPSSVRENGLYRLDLSPEANPWMTKVPGPE